MKKTLLLLRLSACSLGASAQTATLGFCNSEQNTETSVRMDGRGWLDCALRIPAKYFDNSIREDGILRLAFGGIIFTPGSAGTLQEIFQDAVQNHYLSFGYASPMCFLGRRFWTEEVPVYPFLQDMVARGRYRNLQLSLSDDSEDIVQQLIQFRENRQK